MKFSIYIDVWVSVTDPMRPICNVVCILRNFATQKAPNLAKIGCFSAENGILQGPKIVLFIDIAKGDFSESGRHIHVQNLVENPFPPSDTTCSIELFRLRS